MRYLNDATYPRGDESPNILRWFYGTQYDVSFTEMLSPGNQSELNLLGFIESKSFGNIDREIKFDECYGCGY